MLKITIHDSAAECRFQLAGALEGPAVRDLEQSWLTARSATARRRTTVDLRGLESAGPEGRDLLQRMYREGVTVAEFAPPVRINRGSRLAAGAVLPILMLFCPALAFAAEPAAARETLDRYLARAAAPEERTDAIMQLEIRARLAKSGQAAVLRAFEYVPRTGRAAFRVVGFEGDEMVKRQVIARYLAAEAESRERADGSLAVTAQNYRFRFLRADDCEGTAAWVYRAEPRKKRVGLFSGEIWLAADSARVLRHTGRFVKNPSVFVKSVTFTRDFDPEGAPLRLDVRLETRIAGAAELNVRYAGHPYSL